MFRSLQVQNFTVFAQASFEFSPQLNVFVGENGTGKTHVLKLPYAVLATSAEEGRRPLAAPPTKSTLQPRLAEKLIGVFRPEALGRLARRRQGTSRCEVEVRFIDPALDIDFGFSTQSRAEIQLKKVPKAWSDIAPAYLPTRELLTIYPGFLSVYENHYLEFEET